MSNPRFFISANAGLLLALIGLAGALPQNSSAQDRLRTMPGYENYQGMRGQAASAVKMGNVNVTWLDDGKSFDYAKDGKRLHYDIASGATTDTGEAAPTGGGGRRGGRGGRGGNQGTTPGPPSSTNAATTNAAAGRGGRGGRGGGLERGRQATSETSPDRKFVAFYEDHNLWLSDADGGNKTAITTDGSEKDRIKYGTASWVYGEELRQTSAFWWSSHSDKVAYYRFDEGKVPDYFLQMNQTGIHDTLNIEAYPKAGDPNPVVDLFIYDVASKKSIRVDARDGQPLDNSAVGYYVYHVAWSPDGKLLLFNRTNRRQNIMEFCACDPATGKCRVLVREEWPASWTANIPVMRWLTDGQRFIWTSERTGWKNFYLYNLDGKLLATLTSHPFEVDRIERVDEANRLLYYLAHDGDNPMKLQLHRVSLDGKNDARLTDPAWGHTVNIAPDGKHFIDVIQKLDTPPSTRLVDADGKVLTTLAEGDLTKFKELGFLPVERLKFKAGDGETDLYGTLHFPSHFDPNKKYPLLVSVYGGPLPDSSGATETFTVPDARTEYGFLYATFDARSAGGRGKKFTDAIYMKLGIPEIDDQAAGVKSLWNRPYLDKAHVGMFGTSYGGYASAMCLLRYPDVFAAAAASSPPTAWYHYDTIYTERYMWIPQENREGYENGSAMKYAANLKGHLLIYYGTADNNVHPNNSMQLIKALQNARKSFEVQVGPDQGHSGVNGDRMMEFFIENLVLAK